MMALLAAICVVFVLLIIVYKTWWIPVYLQRLMESQGIKGPSYNLFHGSTQEIIKLRQTCDIITTDISHDVFPKIQPHLYTWLNLYGARTMFLPELGNPTYYKKMISYQNYRITITTLPSDSNLNCKIGKNFLYWEGTQPIIVVTEAELIKEILSNKKGKYPKSLLKGYLMKLLGGGIVMAEGERWMKLRKLANHAFHGESLKDMVPAMIATAETMLQRWKIYEGKEIEVCDEFKFLTSEVISRTAFGSSYLEGRKIFDLLENLCAFISRNEFKFRFFGVERFIRREDEVEAEKIEQMLHDCIMEITDKREDEVRTGAAVSYGNDFLGSLLKVHHDMDQKNRISANEFIEECKTFYFAGQETTYSLLSWATLLLAIHTDWQEKARNEVLELFGQENPNSEGIAKLKIVNMILYETLRLYTPVSLITRRVESKVKLGKYEFPANVELVILPLALHRDRNIWGKDVQLFNPERFSEGLAKATNGNTMAFLGFGFGPRTCVGLNFAINEAKIALAMILQRYKFTLSPNYVHSPSLVLTIQPQNGVQVLLQPLV